MKRIELIFIAFVFCVTLFAQAPADRSQVRKGNRAYNLGKLAQAEDLYHKALSLDSNSVAANYNLANTLYKEEKYADAEKFIDKAEAAAVADPSLKSDDIYFNKGNLALQQKNYSTAVEAFKQSLLRNPGDMDARESYIYAKKMLQDQQNNQNQNNQNQNNQNQNQDKNNQDQNKDQQNQNQNQDQNQNKQDQDQNKQDQNQDQNQDKNQDQQDRQQSPSAGQLSKEAMEQMLKANEAKEKQTQEKVKEQEAMRMKSRQKDKNW